MTISEDIGEPSFGFHEKIISALKNDKGCQPDQPEQSPVGPAVPEEDVLGAGYQDSQGVQIYKGPETFGDHLNVVTDRRDKKKKLRQDAGHVDGIPYIDARRSKKPRDPATEKKENHEEQRT